MATELIYLDSSVALRTILDVPERERLQSWMRAPATTFPSSRLLRTEVTRVLRPDSRPLADGLPLLDRVGMLEITRETHTVATHDPTMKSVAVHLGLRVIDPVEDLQKASQPALRQSLS